MNEAQESIPRLYLTTALLVSPAQRHAGKDQAILAARHDEYLHARELNPARWSDNTRNWAPVGAVTLNPERDSVIKTHLAGQNIRPLAA